MAHEEFAGNVDRSAPEHEHAVAGQGGSFVEMLDLDVEVLHEYHTGLMDWIASLAGDVHRVLDIGAGTGAGALALARRFPGAGVVAVDASPDLLAFLTERAHAAGLGDRVHAVTADLDAGWPAEVASGARAAAGEPGALVDLAWASASMHHMGNPDRVIAEVLGALRPGGLFAIVELTGFPRFLPPGDVLEERLHAGLTAKHARDLPHMGDDWGVRLSRAGFTIEAQRQFDIHLTAPLPAATGRYAQVCLERLGQGMDDQLSADERAALHRLVGDDILKRDDLEVRASRTVWIGRRP